jgi:hypothetical protein
MVSVVNFVKSVNNTSPSQTPPKIEVWGYFPIHSVSPELPRYQNQTVHISKKYIDEHPSIKYWDVHGGSFL